MVEGGDDSLRDTFDDFNLCNIQYNSGLETVDKKKYSFSIQPWYVLLLLVERGDLPLNDLRVRHPRHADDGEP